MTPADYRLLIAAVIGIALSIALIIRGRLHPFVGLLCGAFTVGLGSEKWVEDFFHEVLGHAVTVVGDTQQKRPLVLQSQG